MTETTPLITRLRQLPQDLWSSVFRHPLPDTDLGRSQTSFTNFFLHIHPVKVNRNSIRPLYTMGLGLMSFFLFVILTVTGILLMFYYVPSTMQAYDRMLDLRGSVAFGTFLRNMHRWGAHLMVAVVFLHMCRVFFTGSYKKPREFNWVIGVILLLLTLLLSFTGYLLPWDQLALWAVTIGASMIEATPPAVVGENLNLLVRGGPDIGANGLLRFYLLHVLLLPALLFVFTGVHYYKVIIHGHSLPPRKENIGEDTAKRVPLDKRVYFIPDILTSEMMWVAVTTLILVVLCIWFYDAPLEHHADPQITPLGTTAPWYFLWLQGALKLGDKVFWGLIFPGILLGILAVWPYLDLTPSRRYADRRIVITLFLILISFTTYLSYMGLAEFGVNTSADAEILFEMTFPPAHNHMGKILPVPYSQLVPGMYTTAQIAAEEHGEDIGAALDAFNQDVDTRVVAETGTGELTTTEAIVAAELTLDHLSTSSLNFAPIPADAPELHHAMELFYQKFLTEKASNELLNPWGGVVITQHQEGLKRIDVIVSWDEVVIQNGFPVLDENGEPIPVLDANGNPIRRSNITHLFIHEDGGYFSL